MASNRQRTAMCVTMAAILVWVVVASAEDGLFRCRVEWTNKAGARRSLSSIFKNAPNAEAAESLCRTEWMSNGNTNVSASCAEP